jgi:proteasome accessory factor B
VSAQKAERLMNLFILLLVSRNYVSKDQIRDTIEDYRTSTSNDAFEKKFERDKEELRAIGIPIEVGSFDKFFEDEVGYRIQRDAYELPDIEFTSEEVAVLGLAARVWEHAGLAASTADAVLKLRTAGHQADTEVLDTVHLRLPALEAAFDPMLRATQERIPVRFDYRRPGAAAKETRHLQPWGVITSQGRWYVIGYDSAREAPRMFRLSRVIGDVLDDGAADTYTVPEGTDVRALSRSLAPAPSEDVHVEVLARSGAATGLRRWARSTESSEREGWDRLHLVGRSERELIGTLLGYGAAVEVLEPASVREAVANRIGALLTAQGGAP